MEKLVEELRRKVQQLTLRNAQLQSQHDFAMASWQRAVKRAGLLSTELEELRRGPTEFRAEGTPTTVAPYTPILAAIRPRKHLV